MKQVHRLLMKVLVFFFSEIKNAGNYPNETALILLGHLYFKI